MPDPGGFAECDAITDDLPVRQGDVFEWLERSDDPWRTFGLIVTADCDIAQQKHRGILSYVPVLSLVDYLRLFHFPKALERAARPVAEELTRAIRGYQGANVPEFPEPLSQGAALDWVRSRPPADIAGELRIDSKPVRERFLQLAGDYRLVQDALASESYDLQLRALLRLRERQGGGKEKAKERLQQDIQGAFETLPGDCFFIGLIDGRNCAGYIAYLRLVREVQHAQIAVRQSDIRAGSTVARRIARLRSPFVFGLTQQLAAVFTAVGLPDAYDDNRRKLAESLTRTLFTKANG